MQKLLVFIIILGIILACGGTTATQQAAPAIPVNETAADRLQHNFSMALEEAQGGYESQLRATDEEVTSLVVLRLAQTGQLPLTEPRIWFTPGQIHAQGQLNGIETTLTATATIEQGQLITRVETGQMAGFPIPESTKTSLAQTINEALTDALPDLYITGLDIRQGEIIVTGTRP